MVSTERHSRGDEPGRHRQRKQLQNPDVARNSGKLFSVGDGALQRHSHGKFQEAGNRANVNKPVCCELVLYPVVIRNIEGRAQEQYHNQRQKGRPKRRQRAVSSDHQP